MIKDLTVEKAKSLIDLKRCRISYTQKEIAKLEQFIEDNSKISVLKNLIANFVECICDDNIDEFGSAFIKLIEDCAPDYDYMDTLKEENPEMHRILKLAKSMFAKSANTFLH